MFLSKGKGEGKDNGNGEVASSAADLSPWCAMVDRGTMAWPSDENWEPLKRSMTFGVQAMLTDMDDIINDEMDTAPSRKEMAYAYMDYIPNDAEMTDPNVWYHMVPPHVRRGRDDQEQVDPHQGPAPQVVRRHAAQQRLLHGHERGADYHHGEHAAQGGRRLVSPTGLSVAAGSPAGTEGHYERPWAAALRRGGPKKEGRQGPT